MAERWDYTEQMYVTLLLSQWEDDRQKERHAERDGEKSRERLKSCIILSLQQYQNYLFFFPHMCQLFGFFTNLFVKRKSEYTA